MLYMASLLPVAAIRANLMLFLVLIDLLMLATLAIFGLLQPGALIAGLVLSVPYMAVNWAGAGCSTRARAAVPRRGLCHHRDLGPAGAAGLALIRGD
ncbi:hypothetical protein ACFSZS_19845 [Seohaeicola zhoushanensis]